jgi:type II secretory pathway pseudopilin PulG
MSTPDSSRGMTYIEILVAISIFILLGTCVAPISFAWYGATISRSSRSSLLIALRHARAESLENSCEGETCSAGMSHGVSIQPGSLVVFQGDSYASRDERFDEVFESDASSDPDEASEVVFAASTADAPDPVVFVLHDRDGRNSTTSVGALGEISQTY